MNERWKKALVPVGSSIQSALESISASDLRIALVVDGEGRLAGVITDGDIRRGLMRNVGMQEPVQRIMNASPRTVAPGCGRDEVLDLMRRYDLMQIPVVEGERVVGLVVLRDLVEPTRCDNPVCLVAGGFGTRLRPLTESVPKPLLRVGGRPILQQALEHFARSGFHRLFISVHYKSEQIVEYFGSGRQWDVDIQYLHEDQPLGTAGALGLLPEDLGDLPVIVMNGDLLTKVDFARVLDFHREQRAAATLCVREYEYQVPFGVVRTNVEMVVDLVEKPVQQFLINAGMYVLDVGIIRSIPRGRHLEMPQLLQRVLQEGKRVCCFPLHEDWLDVGRLSDLARARSESEADAL
ncbi:MAG: nucleotidyltransferase family protein [Verrucomicrobia bacterium]|nr:nucleotidyltransferase family protein [Verrucomicrobiota bacterium]